MREEIRERKKNNKGFSLVELIIVIAIMAILVAILAPQFLKYVERSRNTADIANAREITNAIIAYAADPESGWTLKTGTVTVTGTSATASDEQITQALYDAGITSKATGTELDVRCKSKTSWTDYKIEIKENTGSGTVTTEDSIMFVYTANGSGASRFASAFQQGSGSSGSSGSGSGGTTGGDSGSTGGDSGSTGGDSGTGGTGTTTP